MFFLLSKLLVIFLYPFTWIIFFLILAFFARNKIAKRNLFITCLVIALLFSNKFLLDVFARSWDIHRSAPTNQTYSCAIILGGFASETNTGQGHFNASADRFIQGVSLVAQRRVDNILISGGNSSIFKGQKFQEADYVSTQLKLFNVPDSIILIENKSKNTLENASLTKQLLEKRNLEPPYLLVTSAFHMRRSLYTFKSAGLEVLPYPCDYKAGNGKFSFEDLLPSAYPLHTWNLYIKEVVGFIVYYFKT